MLECVGTEESARIRVSYQWIQRDIVRVRDFALQ